MRSSDLVCVRVYVCVKFENDKVYCYNVSFFGVCVRVCVLCVCVCLRACMRACVCFLRCVLEFKMF